MPSPLAHSVSGYVFSKLWFKKRGLLISRKTMNFWLAYTVFIANAPDLDFAMQLFSDDKIHRGFTHSVTAALAVSLFAGLIGLLFWKPRWKFLLLLTFMIYGLHLALDAFTAGGVGMKLLWPFTEEYYQFPFPLFPPVHHSRGLVDFSHLIFLSYELVYSFLLLWGLRKWQFFQKTSYKRIFK
jgi:inner membrane protein